MTGIAGRQDSLGGFTANLIEGLHGTPWVLARTGPDPGNTVLGVHVVYTDGGVVVSVRGELDATAAPALRRRLRELMALPIKTLTLELADVSGIDRAGVGVLNALGLDAAERGIVFVLEAVPPGARPVLAIAGTASASMSNVSERGAHFRDVEKTHANPRDLRPW
jgi:anti-anti-sigma factor